MPVKKNKTKKSNIYKNKKNFSNKPIVKRKVSSKKKDDVFKLIENNIVKKFFSIVKLPKILIIFFLSLFLKTISFPAIFFNKIGFLFIKIFSIINKKTILLITFLYKLFKKTFVSLIKIVPTLFFGSIAGALSAYIVYVVIDYTKKDEVKKFDSSEIEGRIKLIEEKEN